MILHTEVLQSVSRANSNRNIDQRRGIRKGSACATDLYTQSGKLRLECSYCKKPHKLENCTAISRLEIKKG